MKNTEWLKKLTLEDIEHLKDGLGKVTLKALKEALEIQKRSNIPCDECFGIGRKLGLVK